MPMQPARQFSCRYHSDRRAQSAVNRGWGDQGWVMLCGECTDALKRRRLVIVAPTGQYVGTYPGGTERAATDLPPDEDLFE